MRDPSAGYGAHAAHISDWESLGSRCSELGCDCWLPENYFFLGHSAVDTRTELDEFLAIRSLLGIDELEFRSAAATLLVTIREDGQESGMNSGSLMAFGESFMAKTMTHEESITLFRILQPYADYLMEQQEVLANGEAEDEPSAGVGSVPVTLLPRICGAFSHSTLLQRLRIVVMSNVFAGVPSHMQATMERFDIKGSADNRTQRRVGAEFLDFDLFRSDRKLVPLDPIQGEKLLGVLARDTAFLLRQSAQDGFSHRWPELLRHEPGLMDYSLLVGLVPCDMPGGVVRLDINDTRTVCEYEPGEVAHKVFASAVDAKKRWVVEEERKTALFGIVDILQFWTTKKLIANTVKRAVGMEKDDGRDCTNDILDTVRPRCYRSRLVRLAHELLSPGSWLESLPRMYGGDWSRVLMRQMVHLPSEQMAKARLRYFDAIRQAELRRRQQSGSTRSLLGTFMDDDGSVDSANASTSVLSLEDFLLMDDEDDDEESLHRRVLKNAFKACAQVDGTCSSPTTTASVSSTALEDSVWALERVLEQRQFDQPAPGVQSFPAPLLDLPQPARLPHSRESPQPAQLQEQREEDPLPPCELASSPDSFCKLEGNGCSQDELMPALAAESAAKVFPPLGYLKAPPVEPTLGRSGKRCSFYRISSEAASECDDARPVASNG